MGLFSKSAALTARLRLFLKFSYFVFVKKKQKKKQNSTLAAGHVYFSGFGPEDREALVLDCVEFGPAARQLNTPCR